MCELFWQGFIEYYTCKIKYYIAFKTLMNTIAEKIRNKRIELGLTQEQLAIKAGIPYTTLSKIENELVKNPTVNTLKKIADALGFKIDDLLNS